MREFLKNSRIFFKFHEYLLKSVNNEYFCIQRVPSRKLKTNLQCSFTWASPIPFWTCTPAWGSGWLPTPSKICYSFLRHLENSWKYIDIFGLLLKICISVFGQSQKIAINLLATKLHCPPLKSLPNFWPTFLIDFFLINLEFSNVGWPIFNIKPSNP